MRCDATAKAPPYNTTTPLDNPAVLSPTDDYPLHQISDVIRHVGTSDRNFYDRYYFNLHGSSDELFMVMGLGQYPNLGVQDAFAVVRRNNGHHVVRASRELGNDRSDTRVGPLRVEVQEGLKRVRFVVEDDATFPLAFDVVWNAAIPAYLEPRQLVRRHGRAMFDSTRFAQTGCWSGHLRIGDEHFEVTPDRWKGCRDRSWGVRPIGEAEPAGIHSGSAGSMHGMWNYCPMQFDDYSILYICNEHDDGSRELEEAVRIWADPERAPELLGRPEHKHRFTADKRLIEEGLLLFPEAPGGALEIRAELLEELYVAVGTGYGLETDWRHGMYQGKEEVVQHFSLDMEKDRDQMFGLIDCAARFTTDSGDVGYGLFEYMFLGPFARYGLK